MSRPIIRPCEDADVDQVISLWRHCGLIRPWNDPVYDIDFCRRSTEAELLVLQRLKSIDGATMVGHDGHRGWFYYLAVMPKFQSKGYGGTLLQAGEAWLRQRGVPKISLMIRSDNTGVQDFYRQAGYTRDDVVVMGKRLIDPRRNSSE